MIIQKFTDKGVSANMFVSDGQSVIISAQLAGGFDGILSLRKSANNGVSYDKTKITADINSETLYLGPGTYSFEVEYGIGHVSLTGTASVTLDIAGAKPIPPFNPGSPPTQPVSGAISSSSVQNGNEVTLTLNLLNARLPVTRSGLGSYGSIPLTQLVQSAMSVAACKQIYSGYVEGAALTGGAGDAQFVMGVGSAPITVPRDGKLAFLEASIGGMLAQTNVGGTTTGQQVTTGQSVDNISGAVNLYLNFSGTAATIDANSTIDVSGTITIVLKLI